MPRLLVYFLYNLLLPVVLVLGMPLYLIKGIRRGGLALNFRQRLGFFSPSVRATLQGKKPIWIHAVSVGEVFLALKVIDAFRQADPAQFIVLSTTTTTGYRVAIQKESDTLTVIHNPIDVPFINARVIRLIAPVKMVLIEAEVWPNLVYQLSRRQIPVLLINARLSPRSERRYLRVRSLIAPIFSLLQGVTVPFEIDRERWSRLGIAPGKIMVTGSVKFDSAGHSLLAGNLRAELSAWLASTGFPPSSRILLAGSTHDGEEKLIATIADELRKEVPGLALVIVPRHAERGNDIALQLRAMDFDPVLRIEPNRVASSTQESLLPIDRRIWIANTTGELRSWFQLAEVVVIGKSFRSEGGQNPVEPILSGKPVVVGPHMENFSDVVGELIGVNGICQVSDDDGLAAALRDLFHHPERGKEMADRGALAMARHEGSAARSAAFILTSS